MSVDTDSLRHDADKACLGKFLVDIRNACDEIDRLRGKLDRAEMAAADDLTTMSQLKKRANELRVSEAVALNRADVMRTELATLRDQLRPRSIKEEPPPASEVVLAWNIPEERWVLYRDPSPANYSVWIPQPPAPPHPDKFEEWAEAQPWWDTCGDVVRGYIKDAIDACKRAYNISD